MKGGERMYIRNVILLVLLTGATAFLPNHTFAEKNGAIGQTQNTTVHTPVSVKNENPSASEKADPVTPVHAHSGQGEVPSTQTTVQKKPVFKSPDKNDKKQKVLPSRENTRESEEPTAIVKDTEQSGRTKTNVVKEKVQEVSKSLSLHQTEEKTSSPSPTLSARSIPNTESTEAKKEISSHTLLHKEEENKTQPNNRKNPRDIDVVNNTPPRTQSSGGQLKEPFSTGTGLLSIVANWFNWDEYFGLNLGHINTSYQAKYRHQWINAPPSPPPKGAPFYLTFTDYLALSNDNKKEHFE